MYDTLKCCTNCFSCAADCQPSYGFWPHSATGHHSLLCVFDIVLAAECLHSDRGTSLVSGQLCYCLHLCVCRDGAEQLSVDRALRALSRAEVVVIVVDASEGVTQQVCHQPAISMCLGQQLWTLLALYIG